MGYWFCNKKRYSKKEAEKVLRDTFWQFEGGNKKRLEQRAYYCSKCNCYHLTSSKVYRGRK